MPPRPYRTAVRRVREEDADRDWERYDERHERATPAFYQSAYVRAQQHLLAFVDNDGREYYHITEREFPDLFRLPTGGAARRFVCVIPRDVSQRGVEFPEAPGIVEGHTVVYTSVRVAKPDVTAMVQHLRSRSRFAAFEAKYPTAARAVVRIYRSVSLGGSASVWSATHMRPMLRYARRTMRRAIRGRNDTMMHLAHAVATTTLTRRGRPSPWHFFERVLRPFPPGGDERQWAMDHWSLVHVFAPRIEYRPRVGPSMRARVVDVDSEPHNLVGVASLVFEGEPPVPRPPDDE